MKFSFGPTDVVRQRRRSARTPLNVITIGQLSQLFQSRNFFFLFLFRYYLYAPIKKNLRRHRTRASFRSWNDVIRVRKTDKNWQSIKKTSKFFFTYEYVYVLNARMQRRYNSSTHPQKKFFFSFFLHWTNASSTPLPALCRGFFVCSFYKVAFFYWIKYKNLLRGYHAWK